MRAGGQHCVRPIAKAFLVCPVKLSRCDSEAVKITSNIIQRDQPVVPVKSGVLKSFRHHRAGELLKLHGECGDCISVAGIVPVSDASQKNFTDEIEDADIGCRTSPFCG